MGIAENIAKYNHELSPYDAKLVAVSKTKPVEMIEEAYHAGQRDFGENKVQELVQKHEQLPKDIRWHMIGHLQRNKVKYIAPFISLIHSVDSKKLLIEINKEAQKNNRVINCLLQIFIAQEATKFGLSEAECFDLLTYVKEASLQHIRIVGLMGMASNTSDDSQVKEEFSQLRQLMHSLKTYNHDFIEFTELSMGMSGDYMIAAKEGSTMVRIGSSVFGHRNYSI